MNFEKNHSRALALSTVLLLGILPEVEACTRIFRNTNPDMMIVGRNEDYVTASHPTLVATPRGIKRIGTSNEGINGGTH